jgi:hypothetical protein
LAAVNPGVSRRGGIANVLLAQFISSMWLSGTGRDKPDAEVADAKSFSRCAGVKPAEDARIL